jgi:septal ring factor EnvC (AmiA/AmiB activator)
MLHSIFAPLTEHLTVTVTIAIIGGIIAGGAAMWGRETKSTGALVLAVLVGAILSSVLLGSGYVGLPKTCKQKVENVLTDLKNRQLQHDLSAAEIVIQKQKDLMAKQEAQLDADDKAIAKVKEALKKHAKDNAKCPTAAFSDELRAIGRLR